MFSSRYVILVLLFMLMTGWISNGRNINRHNKWDGDVLLHKIRKLLDKFHDVPSQDKTLHQEKRLTVPKRAITYLNGTIYTVEQTAQPWQNHPSEALIIEDGVITFVGNTAEAQYITHELVNMNVDCTIFDLGGNVVLPGLHDVHIHPLEAGTVVGGGCKLPSQTAPDDPEMMKKLVNCPPVGDPVGTDWVLGGGHSITNILEHIKAGGRSPLEILDEAIPYKPAIMLEETSHSCWVNSEALYRAGIDRFTPEKPGGIIMRGENNKPNGILFENAVISIMDKALAPNAELNEITYNGLKYSLKLLAQHGITSICDARVYQKRKHDEIWERACNDGILSVRAVLGLWAYPDENDAQQIQKLKDSYSESSPNCDNLLRKTQIKVYSDGLLESTTAAMLSKYDMDLHLPDNPANIGMNYFNQSRLAKYISELQELDTEGRTGFDFHVHTIGDRGVRETLNAIDNAKSHLNTKRRTRHRLTHVEIVHPSDIPKFRDLGVIADFQVAGDFTLPEVFKDHVTDLIGPKRATNFIPVRSIKATGANTTFSSDWDVSDVNPFIGFQHAVQRGDQSVTLSEVVEMYTIIPAFVMRHENTVGSLEFGKAGDLIVIDKDIFKIPLESIHTTKVLQTVLGGRIVYWLNSHATKLRDITHQYYPYY